METIAEILISGIGEIYFEDSNQNTNFNGDQNTIVNFNQNINYHNPSISESLERRVNILEEIQSQQQEQQDCFESFILEVSSLIDSIGNQVDEIKVVQKVQEFKDRVLEIDMKSKACIQAAQWMNKNLNTLIIEGSKLTFNQQLQTYRHPEMSISKEGYKNFQKDLYTLYVWIMDSMIEGGTHPRRLRKEELSLPINYIFYSDMFEAMKTEIVSQYSKELSNQSISMLCMYLDRYLIKRENQEI